MGEHSLHFAALVGSRICHDLISPIGAINNGMELISMTGGSASPEMTLISESVDAANARIRFFRIAYGEPSESQHIGRAEIVTILRDIFRGSRLRVHWEPLEDITRSEVQIAFLALQCAEKAMPYGGALTITRADGRWELDMEAERLNLDDALWGAMQAGPQGDAQTPVIPADVQFLLLPMHAANSGRSVTLHQSPTRACLTV